MIDRRPKWGAEPYSIKDFTVQLIWCKPCKDYVVHILCGKFRMKSVYAKFAEFKCYAGHIKQVENRKSDEYLFGIHMVVSGGKEHADKRIDYYDDEEDSDSYHGVGTRRRDILDTLVGGYLDDMLGILEGNGATG